MNRNFIQMFLVLSLWTSIPANAAPPIQIAAIFAKTGVAVHTNSSFFKEIAFTAKEINKKGGILGQIIELDNRSTLQGSVQAAKEAIRLEVATVIGAAWSSHSLAMAPLLQKAGIPMITPASTSARIPAKLILDEKRIRQILVNLIGNAVKFTSRGYVVARIRSEEQGEDRLVINPPLDIIFEIEDSGIGISREHQELIFESFHQQDAQTTRKYGGAGLGLAITKKLTHLMNGEISVESEVGRGSIFRVILSDVEIIEDTDAYIEQIRCLSRSMGSGKTWKRGNYL